jgi:hypothetical protein
MNLQALARVALARGHPQRAARLLGAAERPLEIIGWAFPPVQRVSHDRLVAAVRDALGRQAFEVDHRRGVALTADQAIAYAMTDEEGNSAA